MDGAIRTQHGDAIVKRRDQLFRIKVDIQCCDIGSQMLFFCIIETSELQIKMGAERK